MIGSVKRPPGEYKHHFFILLFAKAKIPKITTAMSGMDRIGGIVDWIKPQVLAFRPVVIRIYGTD